MRVRTANTVKKARKKGRILGYFTKGMESPHVHYKPTLRELKTQSTQQETSPAFNGMRS